MPVVKGVEAVSACPALAQKEHLLRQRLFARRQAVKIDARRRRQAGVVRSVRDGFPESGLLETVDQGPYQVSRWRVDPERDSSGGGDGV